MLFRSSCSSSSLTCSYLRVRNSTSSCARLASTLIFPSDADILTLRYSDMLDLMLGVGDEAVFGVVHGVVGPPTSYSLATRWHRQSCKSGSPGHECLLCCLKYHCYHAWERIHYSFFVLALSSPPASHNKENKRNPTLVLIAPV